MVATAATPMTTTAASTTDRRAWRQRTASTWRQPARPPAFRRRETPQQLQRPWPDQTGVRQWTPDRTETGRAMKKTDRSCRDSSSTAAVEATAARRWHEPVMMAVATERRLRRRLLVLGQPQQPASPPQRKDRENSCRSRRKPRLTAAARSNGDPKRLAAAAGIRRPEVVDIRRPRHTPCRTYRRRLMCLLTRVSTCASRATLVSGGACICSPDVPSCVTHAVAWLRR